MDARRRIERFLAEVRHRLLRRARRRALLEVAAVVLALATVLPLVAASASAARPARAIGLVLAALALIAGISRGLRAPRRRWASARAVARHVGERAPDLASDLLSTVELEHATAPRRDAPVSAALIDALVESTATRAARLEPAVLVDRQPLVRRGRLVRVALVGLVVAAAVAPARMARGVRNLAAPAPTGRFADATHSDTPLVGDLTITLEPPAYTGRERVALPGASGDFRAMPGTMVEIATTALTPTNKAFLVLESDGVAAGEAMVPLEVDGRALRGRFVVAAATRYRVLLEDDAGRRRIEARARTIELEADGAPTVELHAPADQLDVSGQKRIELAYLADDDHGLAAIELVWRGPDGEKRQVLARPEARKHVQDKLYWDLAEVGLRPGVEVAYWVEVTDNDTVRGPNHGASRRFTLRILSPRERHERLIASQRDAFEKLVGLLGGRLTVQPGDGDGHDALNRDSGALVIELGTLVAALAKDELATPKLASFLDALRDRLDRAASKEAKLLRRALAKTGPLPPHLASQLAASDRAQVGPLEDDVLALADWIDRQDLENLLAMSDEIANHRRRLDKLMAEYARTGSAEIKAEIERELRALEQLLAEQEGRRVGLAEDVLDQFVHGEALAAAQSQDCLAEVRRLVAAGDAAAARAKMLSCGEALDRSTAALEDALGDLRGERFSAEEKRLDELESELKDLAQDQREIAGRLDELNQRYAERAKDRMKAEAARAGRRLSETADKLERRLDKIPDDGLGSFEKEELGAIKTRIGDLERMLEDGDLAEALAMARQAEAGLETIAGELESALDDGDDERWRRDAERALREVEKAQPLAGKLVDELARATPSPADILGKDELGQLDQLERAQRGAAQRAERLGARAKGMAGELPGNAGAAIVDRVGKAAAAMGRAGQRMKARDPSGARPEARAAAEALDAAGKEARGAARLKQADGGSSLRDEPVRIPGADEYRPPADLREGVMDAMKRQGEAPSSYGEMLRRYYEELTR